MHCVKSVCIRSFSCPYFPAFGLSTERYRVSLRIQSEYLEIRTVFSRIRTKISKYGHISRSDGYTFSYWLLFFTSWLFFLILFSIVTGNFFIVIFWYSFSSIVYNILQLISPFTNQDITEEFVIIWRRSKIINPLNASVALIQKPVNWLSQQINWLVSIWGKHWDLMG